MDKLIWNIIIIINYHIYKEETVTQWPNHEITNRAFNHTHIKQRKKKRDPAAHTHTGKHQAVGANRTDRTGSCPRHRQARSIARRRPPQLLARVVAPAVQTGVRRASFRTRHRALLHRSLDTCLGMWLASLSAETQVSGLISNYCKGTRLKIVCACSSACFY